jgi:hypothetical protein
VIHSSPLNVTVAHETFKSSVTSFKANAGANVNKAQAVKLFQVTQLLLERKGAEVSSLRQQLRDVKDRPPQSLGERPLSSSGTVDLLFVALRVI